MKSSRTHLLTYTGIPAIVAVWLLACRFVWEQTVWSWENGPQMIGFSLTHSSYGILLIACTALSLIWPIVLGIAVSMDRRNLNRVTFLLLASYLLGWALIGTPYGFWQRTFVSKFNQTQAIQFLTTAAALGDIRTAEAFLDSGIDVNARSRDGTALHAAATEGQLESIEFLLKRGADVNAINAYGDTPMGRAANAEKNSARAMAMLAAGGGRLASGSEEQRKKILEEQVQRDIEQK